ncbi:MAG: aspartyl/asparaginyl beta-hydroxylase domain-containing protein [Gammaproteobacteria bacterium]|nr:aspartyl/asparaginyl beta-hydroxylase domain-containing protein [Gammaproteobacteria bacterium]
MELAQPFVRLPFQFDAAQLQRELAQFEQTDWMEHPSKLDGNLAIPLISLHGTENNEFAGSMAVTAHLQRCEYMQQVMASFGEVLARSRLMRLNAGAEVSAHVDFNYHWYSRVRIHIPIVTNPDVTFYCGDQSIHMRAGECWIFDSWRRHNVVNAGADDRVHLVIDTAGSARFWNMVREMEVYDNHPDQPELLAKIIERPFVPGSEVTIRTERYNVAPVMAPGELEALARELIADFSAHPANNPAIVAEYTRLLQNLGKDWREIWHLYGYTRKGWGHYRNLLDNTMRQLRPDPRALVTASNQVGVNPIIVQRILRAALHTEQIENFRS